MGPVITLVPSTAPPPPSFARFCDTRISSKSLLTYVILDYPVPVETDVLKVSDNLFSEIKVRLP